MKNNLLKFVKKAVVFLPFLLCMSVFAAVYVQFLSAVPEKSKSILLNDDYNSQSRAITPGKSAEFTLTAEDTVYAIGFNLSINDIFSQSSVNVRVSDRETGEVYTDRDIPAIAITGGYVSVGMDTPITPPR